MPRKIVQEITAVDKTQRAFRSINNSLNGMKSAFAGLTAALGVGSFGVLIKNSIDAADEIQKLSIRLGASTEALSQYQYVAERSGVSFKTLTLGFQRMTRRISEAAQGSGEAKDALRELGVDAERLNQIRPSEQFEVLADALQQVEAPADRVRLAMKLFDSEGVALLQTMENGAQGIRELRSEADALGLTLDQNTADSAAAVNDQMTRLQARFQALALTMVRILGPAVEAILEWFSNAIPNAIGFTVQAIAVIDREINRSVASITGYLSDFYDAAASGARAIGADFLGRAFDSASDSLGKLSAQSAATVRQINNMNLELAGTKATLENAISTQDFYNRSLAESYLKEKQLAGTAKERASALREQQKAIADAARAEQEWQDKLQSVIDSVDPTAPLKRQLDELDKLAEKFPQYADLIGDAMLNIQDSMDNIGESVETNNNKIKEGVNIAKDFGATFSSAFEDAIIGGKGLSDVLKGLEQDILRIVTRQLVTNPIATSVTNLFSSFDLSALFGGFRASGGPVMAGVPYVVGESGPEIVVPKSNSTVIPNGQLGGVVNVYVNAPVGANPEAYRQSARQGALEGSRLLQRGNGIR